jgi:hypothetical protein
VRLGDVRRPDPAQLVGGERRHRPVVQHVAPVKDLLRDTGSGEVGGVAVAHVQRGIVGL